MAITFGTKLGPYTIQGVLGVGGMGEVSDERPYATVGDRFLVTENENDPYASTINLLLNGTTPARR